MNKTLNMAEKKDSEHTHDHGIHSNLMEDSDQKNAGHKKRVITIRSHSGLSGDMLLSGFSVLAMLENDIAPESEAGKKWLAEMLVKIYPGLDNSVNICRRKIGGIAGWHADVNLPEQCEHRTLSDIYNIIEESALTEEAKNLAKSCFKMLAQCEAFAHASTPEHIHFHEVGALDSILDICGVCFLYDFLGCPQIICSPLPMCDGEVQCMHGILPAPAPAVLQLLKGLVIRPFNGNAEAGELLTPTAASLLHIFDVSFGLWPGMEVENAILVYGGKTFANVANGATFVAGSFSE